LITALEINDSTDLVFEATRPFVTFVAENNAWKCPARTVMGFFSKGVSGYLLALDEM